MPNKSLKKLACFLLLSLFVLSSQLVFAGVFSDIKLWVKERKNIYQHSKVVKNSVKTLFKERNSMRNFAKNTNNLVLAYKSFTTKNAKADIPKLVSIAKSIAVVIKEFQNLTPKVKKMYNQSKNSLAYFSELVHNTGTIKKAKGVIKKIPNEKILKLAGANGWSRVFSSVKDNPLNLFKWGRLKDEYDLGKTEAQYPLKCAQMTIETLSYYKAADKSIQQLLGIQEDIKGLIGGDLTALLNISSTVNKIKGAGKQVEDLGNIAEKGYSNINKRMSEFLTLQDNYVKKLDAYNKKYNKKSNTDGNSKPTEGSQFNSNSNYSSSTSSNQSPNTTSNQKIPTVTIQQAMTYYQSAYQNYVKIANTDGATQKEINEAIKKLQYAKKIVAKAKAAAQ